MQSFSSWQAQPLPWWVIWLKISIEWGISHLDIELYYVVENQLFLTCFVQSQNKAKFDFLISKMQARLKHHWQNRFNEIINTEPNNFLTQITYDPFIAYAIQSFSIGWRLNTISKIINEWICIQTKSIRFNFTKIYLKMIFKKKW